MRRGCPSYCNYQTPPKKMKGACTTHYLCLPLFFYILASICGLQTDALAGAVAQSGTGAASQPSAERPTQSSSHTSAMNEGLIKLDVVITDKSGKPVDNLKPQDFALLDNGKPSKILSFQSFDGISAKPDPPVEVILLIDTLQMPANLISLERNSVEAFLRKNGGNLAQPVSIFSLLETGLWLSAKASTDGNYLASRVAHNSEVVLIRRFRGSLRGDVPASLDLTDPPALEALEALGEIATAERRKPGRKLLLWVGPGWGRGSGEYAEGTVSGKDTFYTIRWFSTLLRESRIALYSFSVGETDPRSQFYLDYLRGVQSSREASFMNLYRKVLAVQSGGRALEGSDDLIPLIENCVQEASAFYTLSFDPSPADHPDEFHDIKVQIDKPGLNARTNTGYYDQPYYSDQPNLATRPVTVQQLRQVLTADHGDRDGDVAQQLSGLELTERLDGAKLVSWTAALRGKRSRQALIALADASAFLDPPRSEISADAPPDAIAQRHMISLAADYLNKTIPKLPNFVATRTTVRYEESAQFNEGSTTVHFEPLRVADNFKETVLYRDGNEVAGAAQRRKQKEPSLITYGTFGPALGFARDAIAVPGDLTWSRWERGANGPRAIFRYRIPAEKSLYRVWGCCLPDGDGTGGFQRLAGYQGEIAIDPTSGAILRLEAEADLKGFTPVVRSDIVVEYGPVVIGGKSYVCPVRSVSLMRMRSVANPMEWDEGFRTYGPYVTMLNDITYEDYHLFRAESHLLTGFDRVQDENHPDSGSGPPPTTIPPAPQ